MDKNDNMFVKEFFAVLIIAKSVTIIVWKIIMREVFLKILSECLSASENAIFIEILEGSFYTDYYYLDYDSEEFGRYICWGVFQKNDAWRE